MPSENNPAVAVSIQGVTKRFGRTAALDSVSADFAAGTLITLLGENGAGKSTLLRVIAGLTKPNGGSVKVNGASDPRLWCADIGYMAHASLLYEEMTGAENLHYFAGLYGIPPQERANTVEDRIRQVGLDPALETYISGYSQGMRQRLSLARAILHAPKVLLLDEPFSNTDTAASKQMVRYIASQRDAGCTVLVVTHQPALLEEVADEFITMNAGRIIERRAGTRATGHAAKGARP